MNRTSHPSDQRCLLLIDDEPDMLSGLARILSLTGHRVATSSRPEQIRQLLDEHAPDVVLTDLRMPGLDGLGVLRATVEHAPDIPVIVLTAYGSVDSAVQLLKEGAFDYLTKPVGRDRLIEAVERALVQHEVQRDFNADPEAQREKLGCAGLVGHSEALRHTVALLRKVARTDANVVITGESGTGKEVVARCLHSVSHRTSKPFIPVDCASLPETLLESELFGHERGAFTGAIAQRPGVFELADGGTLLLDEIGEMSLSLQAKLLRVAQEQCFRRVGGREEIGVNVRILSATNRDLARACEEGIFRQDLYYRLSVITVPLPPLRDRQGDIRILAHHFLESFMRTADKRIEGFTPEAVACLESHRWPGNVRELQNVIERATVLSDGLLITPDDLPDEIAHRSGVSPPSMGLDSVSSFHAAKRDVVQRFERDYLVEQLRRAHGNVSRAARDAGMNRRTLYRLIEKFDIDVEAIRLGEAG
ncbi:sigma-54-dependent Fis family transcriptional regulator [Candidatus Sumerlaeota bacterium]|nr:sigma-54-dependent Fis family transcriptional regulator [Candidatus Sumerlaeota bacterium]